METINETKYSYKVYPLQGEDGSVQWTAECIEIKGLVGGGDSPEEAIKELEENMPFHLAAMEENGIKIPSGYAEPEYSGNLSVRLGKRLHKEISEYADKNDTSINETVCQAVRAYISEENAKDKQNFYFENLFKYSPTITMSTGMGY